MYKNLNLFGYFLYFELLSALTRKAFNDVVELTVGIVPIVECVTGVSKLGVCGLLGCGVLLCCMCALMVWHWSHLKYDLFVAIDSLSDSPI